MHSYGVSTSSTMSFVVCLFSKNIRYAKRTCRKTLIIFIGDIYRLISTRESKFYFYSDFEFLKFLTWVFKNLLNFHVKWNGRKFNLYFFTSCMFLSFEFTSWASKIRYICIFVSIFHAKPAWQEKISRSRVEKALQRLFMAWFLDLFLLNQLLTTQLCSTGIWNLNWKIFAVSSDIIFMIWFYWSRKYAKQIEKKWFPKFCKKKLKIKRPFLSYSILGINRSSWHKHWHRK